MNIEKVIEIVKSAKPLFMDRDNSQKVDEKGAADYVTAVDFAVQNYLQEKLKEAYPEVQFMGEEKDNSDIDFSGKVWILDPVDGTTNLIHDFHGSAISFAYAENKEVKLGVIYIPTSDELFYAEKGKGAFLNGNKIHVSGVKDMAHSLISIGPAPYTKEWAELSFEMYLKIYKDSQDFRRIGSAAIELAYVACGRIEAYIEPALNPWDFAAGLLIIEEAGGSVVTLDGEKVDITKRSSICSSNGPVGEILVGNYLPPSKTFRL